MEKPVQATGQHVHLWNFAWDVKKQKTKNCFRFKQRPAAVSAVRPERLPSDVRIVSEQLPLIYHLAGWGRGDKKQRELMCSHRCGETNVETMLFRLGRTSLQRPCGRGATATTDRC